MGNVQEDFLTSLAKRTESLGKIALVVASIAYAVGVYLTSSDLAQYNVTNYSLARPQYILAGGSWLAASIIVISMPAVAALVTDGGRLAQWSNLRLILIGILGPAWMIYSLVDLISECSIGWLGIVAVFFVDLTFFALARSAASTYRTRDRNAMLLSGNLRDARISRNAGMATVAFGIIFWVPVYTNFIFPCLPPHLGGGKHPLAVVTFKASEKFGINGLATVIGPITITNLSTDELRIVASDADFLVVVREGDKGNAVSFSKGMIASIQYRPEQPRKPFELQLIDRLVRWQLSRKKKH